jgi:hypothetical protein
MTATAANAIVEQTIIHASASVVMGVWLKRLTGTGLIKISQDNGTTLTTVTLTSSWQFFQLPAQTIINPQIWIVIATNGDSIAVDFVSERVGAVIPDPIATTTTTVTQAADGLSFPFMQTTFSAFTQTINQLDTGTGTFPRILGSGDGSVETAIFIEGGSPQFGSYNGARTLLGPTVASALTNLHKTMAAGSPTGTSITSDAKTPVTDANPLWDTNPVNLWIGSDEGTTSFANGDFKQLAMWFGTVASAADMQRLTT